MKSLLILALIDTENCVGTGDFRSCYYDFDVTCANLPEPGPHRLHVKAEYFPLADRILDIGITAQFLQ